MAADMSVRHAANVCLQCRTRKKKCDKRLPYCGFCKRKGLECDYQYSVARSTVPATVGVWDAQALRLAPFVRSSLLLMDTVSSATPSQLVLGSGMTLQTASSVDVSIYLQVQRIIDATGQSVSLVVQRYLEGLHSFAPILSWGCLQTSFLTSHATPTPDLSILLLVLSLVTFHPDLASHGPDQGPDIEPETLYLTTVSLFAQVQATSRPSLRNIQASLFLAIYEYACGKLEQAAISIGNCARTAQLAIILTEKSTAEELRTWWCIAICERYSPFSDQRVAQNTHVSCSLIYCDTPDPNHLLTSSILSTQDMQLPPEPETEEWPPTPDSSGIHSPNAGKASSLGWFRSAAQASQLLDEVLQVTKNSPGTPESPISAHLAELNRLDQSLQSFLAVLLDQRQERWNRYCMPNAITIRALFTLHAHILRLVNPISTLNPTTRAEWEHRSLAARDTLAKIVTETTFTHLRTSLRGMDSLPPVSGYNVRTSLEHVLSRSHAANTEGGNPGRFQVLEDAELRLRGSLERFRWRWHFNG
ncbi:hypothetical protein BJX64DRAFT_84604 [Aspergillus heterothallicus]